MTLPFAITDDVQESPIVYFLQNYQQCVFYKMDKIKNLPGNKIICIKHNASKTDCLNAISATDFSEYHTSIFLVPKKIEILSLPPQYRLVFYPI